MMMSDTLLTNWQVDSLDTGLRGAKSGKKENLGSWYTETIILI